MPTTTPHPPSVKVEPVDVALSEEQEKKRVEVLEYVADEGYRIPGLEKGELEEREKFWLVSYP